MIARLEIDLDAMRRNVRRLRPAFEPATYAAVVKANAYGHGLVETARAVAPEVDAFCTYRVDEAATLREAGIAQPILVLGPVEPSELVLAHRLRVSIALWSKGAYRRDAARIARDRGAPFAVHAKIDTGVTRLGLDADRATAALASYLDDPDFDLRGVFTHLAAAEELDSEYTREQLGRFRDALEPIAPALARRGVVRHAAASAAGLLYPESRFEVVRAGIATYGIWPSPQTRRANAGALELEPALAWTSDLVAVRTVEAGRSVGYGCTFHTTRESRIGVLPIGYAEGLPRALSNRGTALVGGIAVPFVGRICMNMAFLDVTEVPSAAPGSRVTLVGRDGALVRDVNDLAADAGTIGYELVARLPAEVPRIYLGGRARRGRQATAAIASARSSVPS